MDYIRIDTRNVLRRDYRESNVRHGLIGCETPIFDNLAAERFARDES